ncbi:tail protein X [Thermoleptolyngbya sp. M55_K2018_002]|uniref:tail protein X n=1 Tax=Thermoleptolyngbya sp. M55_K2018_002 TaxID=2747808 RepID=UPI0019F7C435|nr:tail protein X [Thermoleptolyngbya sp. M55_K2018_002]HIK42152.1 tail protein X [Thermoleptolyngbya sp. M55_K2018_002]
MSEFIEYTTTDDERWDWIAFQAYGDPYGYETIIRANPEFLGVRSLSAGTILRVPVVEQAAPTVDLESLPPWKR